MGDDPRHARDEQRVGRNPPRSAPQRTDKGQGGAGGKPAKQRERAQQFGDLGREAWILSLPEGEHHQDEGKTDDDGRSAAKDDAEDDAGGSHVL